MRLLNSASKTLCQLGKCLPNPHSTPKPCILRESNKATHMDDFWTEIQDMPGEIFDITELEENDSKMNIQLDEFSNTDYTV